MARKKTEAAKAKTLPGAGEAWSDEDLLRFLAEYASAHGAPPSQREIARATGVPDFRKLMPRLRRLEHEGLVRHTSRLSRSLIVTDKGKERIGGAAKKR